MTEALDRLLMALESTLGRQIKEMQRPRLIEAKARAAERLLLDLERRAEGEMISVGMARMMLRKAGAEEMGREGLQPSWPW